MYWQELTTGIYPWDLHDEGVDTVLDNLQNEAGCNAAYLIALMHHEKRPLHDNYYHHNPVRKRYVAEDSRIYWHPHPEAYENSRIKPLPSERDFLKDTDWLNVFVKAQRQRGMKTGAEISHTPLDKRRAATEFSDCIQRDIYGRTLAREGHHAAGQQLCWNNPDAVAYMVALVTDLATNYDLDMIQTCNYLFHQGNSGDHPLLGVSLGGCFCTHCEKAAARAGLDWEQVKNTVRYWANVLTHASIETNEDLLLLKRGDSSAVMLLLEYPILFDWLRFRCNGITEYFKELSSAIHAANPRIDFRYNSCWQRPELVGLDREYSF